MKKSFISIGSLAIAVMIMASCKKNNSSDPTPTPTYDVPATYNFTNVNYADATTRLGMFTEIQNAQKVAVTGVLDAQICKDMMANANNRFTTAGYNTSGLQISNQMATAAVTDAYAFIDTLAKVSKTGVAASRGIAGVGASSANAATKYALTGLGYNYAQVYTKAMMTAFISVQISKLLTTGIASNVDNTTVVAGSGTALEHNWDLAFGYWSVPNDFPTNKTGVKFWGSYTSQVDAGYKVNDILMKAYLKGRAAISNKDLKTMNAQAAIILEAYEKLAGASALQEVQEAKASISDPVARNSRMSELYGFIYGLKYFPNKKITDAQITNILGLFPKNLWDLSLDDINKIRDAVAAVYGFESVKDIL